MRKPTILCLVTFSGGVDPLAWEQLRFVRKLALVFPSLAVVRHEVFAKIKFKVVGCERLQGDLSF